eukprot:m51a1_g14127 hypothetical protein (403) ;mRNA; f:206993-208201
MANDLCQLCVQPTSLEQLSGHADVLAQGSHWRLGSGSPVRLLGMRLLRDLCRATAEALVVLDAQTPCLPWLCDTLPRARAPLPPLLLRTSGSAPGRWRWREGPSNSAVVVGGSAAAQWGAGLVLACGGLASLPGGGGHTAGPSRLYDAGLGEWVPCGVPALGVVHHTAVSHEGRCYALGGYRTEAREGCSEYDRSTRARVLAEDGSAWTEVSGSVPGPVDSACSLGGSLWALVYADASTDGQGSSSSRWGAGLRLVHCDPREGRWQDAGSGCSLGAGLGDVSLAACGCCVCAVGGSAPEVGRGPTELSIATGTRRCQRVDVRMASAWQSMASLIEGRSRCGLACLEGRQCLVALGGKGERDGTDVQSVELWVPTVDRWFAVEQLPVPCQNLHRTTVALRVHS